MHALKEPQMKAPCDCLEKDAIAPDTFDPVSRLAAEIFLETGDGTFRSTDEDRVLRNRYRASLKHRSDHESDHDLKSNNESGPLYEDGHLILSESFRTAPDRTTEVWNGRVLSHLPETPLIDVQCIWEGYDGNWIEGSPLLLRFETIDVVLAPDPDGKNITVWTGFLNTEEAVYAHRSTTDAEKKENEISCLNWLPFHRDDHLTGKQVTRAHLFTLISQPTSTRPSEKITFCKASDDLAKRSVFMLSLNDGRTCTFLNREGTIQLCVQ